jgi:hypothetical protein
LQQFTFRLTESKIVSRAAAQKQQLSKSRILTRSNLFFCVVLRGARCETKTRGGCDAEERVMQHKIRKGGGQRPAFAARRRRLVEGIIARTAAHPLSQILGADNKETKRGRPAFLGFADNNDFLSLKFAGCVFSACDFTLFLSLNEKFMKHASLPLSAFAILRCDGKLGSREF